MKRFILAVLCIIVISFLGIIFLHHKITHLSNDSLEWVDNRKIDEKMFFRSQYGNIDTLIITQKEIHNSINPINFKSNFSKEAEIYYEAYAEVKYILLHNHDTIQGSFLITNIDNAVPIEISATLGNRLAKGITISTFTYSTTHNFKDDAVYVDDYNSKIEPQRKNKIYSFVYGKKNGLLQYTFVNGETFKRIR
jgi:hypothetical protein